MLLPLILLLLFSIAGHFRACRIRKYLGTPSKHILWLLAWRRSGGLYKMDHHPSFPVQHRRDLKSCRRDLQMANLLLLTLLLLLLSSLLLVVTNKAPKTMTNSSSESKTFFQKMLLKNKRSFLESDKSVPESNKSVDNKIQRIFKGPYPKDVFLIVKIRAKREKNFPEVGGGMSRWKNRYLEVRCQPNVLTDNTPSGLTENCYSMVKGILLSYKVRVKGTIFDVYDKKALHGLQESLALPKSVYGFYVRCMKTTDLDARDAKCRGGPVRKMLLDRFVGGFYEKNTKNSYVELGVSSAETLYYFGRFEMRFETQNIGRILCGAGDKMEQIALEEGTVHIVQKPEESEGLYVVGSNTQRTSCDNISISAQETTILNMLNSEKTFSRKIEHNFKGNLLELKRIENAYFTPFKYEEIPHGKDLNVFYLFPHSLLGTFLNRSYSRSKGTATEGDKVNEFHCHSGNNAESLRICVELFRQHKRNGFKYENYVVSPKLSFMGSFTRQLLPYHDQAHEIEKLLPMFFLTKGKVPVAVGARTFDKGVKAIKNVLKNLPRGLHLDPPEGPKEIGDFSLATLMTTKGFEGGIVLTHDHDIDVKGVKLRETWICSDFVVEFSTRNWKIYVDETLLSPPGKTEPIEANSFIQLTFGSFKYSPEDQKFKLCPTYMLPVGSKLVFRHRDDPSLDPKSDRVTETCNGVTRNIDKKKEIEWNMLTRWILTSRKNDEWYNWAKRPKLKDCHSEEKKLENAPFACTSL